MTQHRLLTSSMFALAAILFLLPFFSVQCTGRAIPQFQDLGVPPSELRFELTGADLVFGRVPDPQARALFMEFDGPGTAQRLAIALGVAVLAGILLSGLPGRAGGVAGATLGLVGLALLILLGRAVDQEVHQRTVRTAREVVSVEWEVGAWGVAALLTAAFVHGTLRAFRGGTSTRAGPHAPPEGGESTSAAP